MLEETRMILLMIFISLISNILLEFKFSGYHFVTSERDYWRTQPDLKVPFVSEIISRDKYLKIKNIFMLLTIKIWKWETV